MRDAVRGWIGGLLLASALFPGLAGAQVYHWADDEGTAHYSTGIESVPERFRDRARLLPVSPVEPAPTESPNPARPAGATIISFTPGSPILVSARINGAGPVTLVLDTGSDRTVISPAALWRLGIATPNTFQANIKGVTGAALADVVWVSSVEVAGVGVGTMPIVAHDADLQQADGLLGRDFLSRFTVTIDTKASIVILTPNAPD